MKKKYILCIGCLLVLALVGGGVYVWIAPPIGSNFYYWDEPESICESVVMEDVNMKFKGLDMERDSQGRMAYVSISLKNSGDKEVIYDGTVFRLDYWYLNRWKTVAYNVFPIGVERICHGKEEKEDIILLSKGVVSYPGRYRLYLKDVGFVEFETFKNS